LETFDNITVIFFSYKTVPAQKLHIRQEITIIIVFEAEFRTI